jgi:hypothetical protein
MMVFLGLKDSVLSYVNMGYEYVCTCLIDANGIKTMLGASEESSAVFSSCSESGANQSVEAAEAKKKLEADKKAAAAAALKKAAKNKMVSDEKAKIVAIVDCATGGSSKLESCWTQVMTQKTLQS